MGRISGKVALVAGAGGGIGGAGAEGLAREGAAVFCTDYDAAAAEATAARIRAAGGRAAAAALDVRDRAAVDAAVAAAVREFGRLDIVLESAGIAHRLDFLDVDPETWDRVIAVNLTGTFVSMQLAVPDMIEAQWGRIVTISSSSAQSGAPNMAHYVASKGGVIGLTKAFARELAGHGITVNTIPPTIVDTPMARKGEEEGHVPSVDVMAKMVPLKRAGTPDDIAGACSYLCSEDGAYVTGQIIGVNGGMYI